mmetsp:Transcript_41296/g.66978  ORF Transcript_41296/g.66978 Transcript_41296/m.66978 type:complete len:283 (-) Transcript_41296:386-1234(-)
MEKKGSKIFPSGQQQRRSHRRRSIPPSPPPPPLPLQRHLRAVVAFCSHSLMIPTHSTALTFLFLLSPPPPPHPPHHSSSSHPLSLPIIVIAVFPLPPNSHSLSLLTTPPLPKTRLFLSYPHPLKKKRKESLATIPKPPLRNLSKAMVLCFHSLMIPTTHSPALSFHLFPPLHSQNLHPLCHHRYQLPSAAPFLLQQRERMRVRVKINPPSFSPGPNIHHTHPPPPPQYHPEGNNLPPLMSHHLQLLQVPLPLSLPSPSLLHSNLLPLTVHFHLLLLQSPHPV